MNPDGTMQPIGSAAELYAHAIAIEREAAERYAEFADRMVDWGNYEVAAVFAKLARHETAHLHVLQRKTECMNLPAVAPCECKWFGACAPESAAHELIFQQMTPLQALAMALDAERRAHAFFERVYRTADDPPLRAVAQEMMMEESEHIAVVQRLLQRSLEPLADCAAVCDGDCR